MTKLSIVAGSVLALAAAAAAAGETAVPTLAVDQIVARNVAARGGLDAWRGVKTLTYAGELDAGGKKNTELPFVAKMKRPNKNRLEIRFQDQTALQVFDGTQGWKYRPFLGRDEVEPFTAAEAKEAASWAELDGPLVDHQAKGIRVEAEGSGSVEGHPAYKLKLTFKDGETRHLWIDAGNFLELKIEGEPRRLDGRAHQVAIFYRDFRPESGVVVPHTYETVVDGVKPSRKMTIDRVAVNQPLGDDLFVRPQPHDAVASNR